MAVGEALGRERRLIFENIANGVPAENVMVAFKRSRLEIQQEVEFVMKKITEYRWRRLTGGATRPGTPATARPLVKAETYAEIRQKRGNLLETLRKLTDVNLGTALVLPSVNILTVDSIDAVQEVQHRMRG